MTIFSSNGIGAFFGKVKFFFFLIVSFLFVSFFIFNQKKEANQNHLFVYAYGSFISPFGPGPSIKSEFEKICHCHVKYVRVEQAGLLLKRLQFKKRSKVDVILGLDQMMLKELPLQFWKPIQLKPNPFWDNKIESYTHSHFIPYDWAPLTFIYREGEIKPPQNFRDLLDPSLKKSIVIQDPRTSSPGLHLARWVKTLLGESEGRSFVKNFRENVLLTTSSWSSAYGLFQKGQAQLVFSYLTSLVYHWMDQDEFNYKALQFSEGHPFQVEYAAIPRQCEQCDLAKQYVEFLLTPQVQSVLARKNYMLPVVQDVLLPEAFSDLPPLVGLKNEKPFNKETLIKFWFFKDQ